MTPAWIACLALAQTFAPLYREALERRTRELGAAHPRVAGAAADYALYLASEGRLNDAARLLEQALSIEETSSRIEELARLYDRQGDRRAQALYQRLATDSDAAVASRALARLGRHEEAVRAAEKAHGGSHPEVAVRLNGLALSLSPVEAEPLLRRAVAIQRSSLGARHPETAVTMSNLANVLLARRRVAEAETLQRTALEALTAALGDANPKVATSASNLADVLAAKGDLAGAARHYRLALAIDEKAYGPTHPEIAVDLRNLASVSTAAESARLLKRAETIERTAAPGSR